jgi:hypothetical protein
VLATAADFREERAELHALIATGMFDRAPHLLNFLSYVCEQSFQGHADQIKEYTIGVEALRRAPDFDPKRDSIVRVEAHRLRKRLDEYYSADGATHRVRIVIPQGQYAPRFVLQVPPVKPVQNVIEITPGVPPPAPLPVIDVYEKKQATVPVQGKSWLRNNWVSIGLLLCASVSLLFWRNIYHVAAGRPVAPVNTPATVAPVSLTQPVSSEFRMLAGYIGQPVTDQQGHVWSPDAYFTGGVASSISNDHWIEGAPESKLLETQRSGEFRYDIPLTKGTHELRLHFVETEFGLGNRQGGGETARMFRLLINGKDAVPWLDPIAEAGGPKPLTGPSIQRCNSRRGRKAAPCI